MSSPYIGEIRLFGGNFNPRGWMRCYGQLIAIADYNALFALIGTTYGGDGITTFGLPDLRGRIPVHQGTGPGLSNRVIGERAGVETVTLTSNQIPLHTHTPVATTAAGNVTVPGPTVIPAKPVDTISTPTLYVVPGTSTVVPGAMAGTSISSVGQGQPHDNMMPNQTLNYIIAVEGIFPSRN
ncbi:phage tail protein [Novosphingobium sp. B 225]|uniref:phage tail protein n=1 Tax=Novosphingobium sp. B 225 TaxID=1961849 RepID=UPI000B4B701C|nr:tail fiber protein [Novosphingobium sp. B 225]